MESALIYLVAGILMSFVGTLPLGPINLTVVKTAIDHTSRHGVEVAIAAALIEILEVLVAFSFGQLIVGFLDTNRVVQTLTALVCFMLAAYFSARKPGKIQEAHNPEPRSFYLRGFTVALVNPQAIPFWIFALAVLNQYLPMDVDGSTLALFLGGVFVGKLMALLGFVYVSGYLKTHTRHSSLIVNRVLAIVLVIAGFAQLWSFSD